LDNHLLDKVSASDIIENKQPDKEVSANLFAFMGVLVLGLFFCLLLSLAYPEGLINEEMLTYWLLRKDFQWFAPNQLDWYRTVPYGALLGFAAQLPYPTRWLYWLNSSIFSLNYALVFLLGLSLFSSRKIALTLAISSLVFEVVAMRMFYNNLGISPDALIGEAVFLAVLLVLSGWMRQSTPLLLAGYAVFGLASFMKPMGVGLWPVWLPLSIIFAMRNFSKLNHRLVVTIASIVLMVGPVSLWSFRNFCVYGYALSSGVGGQSLLQVAIPLITNDERLFDSAKTDADFRLTTRACEDFCHKYIAQPDENFNENLARQFRYERYFITGPASNNPFQVLLAQTWPGWHGVGYHWLLEFSAEQMFKMNAEAGRVALRIIRDHPLGYLGLVLNEYATMFSPLNVWTNPLYSFQSNPLIAYTYWDQAREGPRQKYPELFMGKDFASGADSNLFVAQALGLFSKNPLSQIVLKAYFYCEFWLSHVTFLAALLFLWKSYRSSSQCDPDLFALRRQAFTLVMLFLTAAVSYFLIATCQIARMRYLLIGEMELHLMFVLSLVIAGHVFRHRIRPYPLSSKSAAATAEGS
jgi:hypothetical protein